MYKMSILCIAFFKTLKLYCSINAKRKCHNRIILCTVHLCQLHNHRERNIHIIEEGISTIMEHKLNVCELIKNGLFQWLLGKACEEKARVSNCGDKNSLIIENISQSCDLSKVKVVNTIIEI